MPIHPTRGSRSASQRKAFVLLLAFASVVLAACSSGGDDSVTVEGDGEGAPAIEGQGSGPIEFSDDDGGGSVVLGGGEVPDDFPDDIPLPDDYVVTAAFTGSTAEGATANVSGVTGESLDTLHTLYAESLPAAGYTIVSDVGDPIDGAEAFAMTFEGNGLTGGTVTYAARDFSGENPDKFSLSVAY